MTKIQAQGFYEIHKNKPFYEELTDFMSSGQCMVLVLEKVWGKNMKWSGIIFFLIRY